MKRVKRDHSRDLKHLMTPFEEHGMKFAIIENEFGEVGVDENIIKEDAEEQVIEVMNGCICCTVRGDLVKAPDAKRQQMAFSSWLLVCRLSFLCFNMSPLNQSRRF